MEIVETILEVITCIYIMGTIVTALRTKKQSFLNDLGLVILYLPVGYWVCKWIAL